MVIDRRAPKSRKIVGPLGITPLNHHSRRHCFGLLSNDFDEWSKDDIFGPREADHCEFYEGKFDLKGIFPTEQANIVKLTKNISNHSEVIDALTNLENLLAGKKTEIEM